MSQSYSYKLEIWRSDHWMSVWRGFSYKAAMDRLYPKLRDETARVRIWPNGELRLNSNAGIQEPRLEECPF